MNTYSYFRVSYEDNQLHKTLQTRRNLAIQVLHDSSHASETTGSAQQAELMNQLE
ncbi:hypothetical protein [uncultured Thiothrix sp.]|uniref:hypothetical protein n=1 Tax=uncultured Thiothrix sp. TaxID=223185 RepID=UPI00262B6579|nr:hypothetical protein [uncultured Thiothrix sp.]